MLVPGQGDCAAETRDVRGFRSSTAYHMPDGDRETTHGSVNLTITIWGGRCTHGLLTAYCTMDGMQHVWPSSTT
jgi:hypothetical protein